MGLRERKWRIAVDGFRHRTTVVDFRRTRSVVCFRRRMTILGRPTNAVGGVCGLQTENDSNELKKENDRGGIPT